MQFRCVIALSLCLSALCLQGATKPKEKLADHYSQWLNRDAVYIITNQERKEFLALTNDDARDKFIDDFWETRNPIRGAKPNRFKEEHYSRIEYAIGNFGRKSNTPGWMTDMGRAWILFGKPDTRAPYTGYGQIYPLELWFYTNKTGNPAFPSFFYVMFLMPEDIGEYKFYRPYLDGPLKLVRGSQFNSNASVYRFLFPLSGELARAAFSLIPGEPLDTQDFSVSMGSDMLVTRIQNYANDQFYVRRINELRSMRAKVTSSFFVQDDRPLDLSVIAVADPLGQYWVDYSVLINGENLGTWAPDRKSFAINLGYRLLNAHGDLIVEDSEESGYPSPSDSDGKFRPFQIANRLPLAQGSYKLEVQILNRASGRTYKGDKTIEAGLASIVAGPLLVASVQQVRDPKPAIPFQYFGAQFVPGRDFGHRDGLRVLLQIQNPKQQDYKIEYILAHTSDRNARRVFTDEAPAAEFRNGTLLRSRLIKLDELGTGDYRLVTNLRATGQTASGQNDVLWSSNQAIRIIDDLTGVPLFFASSANRLTAPGVSAYVRGLEALSTGDLTSASAYLKQAVNENPSNVYAVQLAVQTFYRTRSFGEVSSMYKKLGVTPFTSSAETIAQVAISLWKAGDAALAHDVLQSGAQQFPGNALIAATAKSLEHP